MFLDVANIDAPELVWARCPKRHFLLWLRLLLGPFNPVEISVLGHDTSTSAGTQLNAIVLLERGCHAELANCRLFLQPLDLRHHRECGLPSANRWPTPLL